MSSYRMKSLPQIVREVSRGDLNVEDAAKDCRADIERYEPRLQAWVEVTDLEVELSKPVRQDLPLTGVMIGVKDIIDVEGLPTRCGSPVTDDSVKKHDADCIVRLRELGVVVQGKTVSTEFGYFSPGPTTNPFNEAHTPGGSSSGSAAAVGAGTLPFALGTQTAGSLTRPASYCGVAGLVLSAQSTSMRGISGLSETLDSLGMLARTVEDLDLVFREFSNCQMEKTEDMGGLTVLVWEGSGLVNLDPEMAYLIHIVTTLLEDLGARTAALDWDDHIWTLVEDHKLIMGFEAATGLGQSLGERRRLISPQLVKLLEFGDSVHQSAYREAMFRREVSLESLLREMSEDTIIVGPAAQGAAPRKEEGTGSPELSRPWQLLGLPVLTVPGARTSKGLPLGVQMIGRRGSETTLLQLGAALEPMIRALPTFNTDDTQHTLKDMKW